MKGRLSSDEFVGDTAGQSHDCKQKNPWKASVISETVPGEIFNCLIHFLSPFVQQILDSVTSPLMS